MAPVQPATAAPTAIDPALQKTQDPLAPTNFGQTYLQPYSDHDIDYLYQQQSHPFARGLQGAALGAMLASSLAGADNREMMPGLIIGGLLGGGAGLLGNMKMAEKGRRNVDRTSAAINANDASFKQNVNRIAGQDDAAEDSYAFRDDLQNPFDATGASQISDVADYAKQRDEYRKRYMDPMQQGLGAEVLRQQGFNDANGSATPPAYGWKPGQPVTKDHLQSGVMMNQDGSPMLSTWIQDGRQGDLPAKPSLSELQSVYPQYSVPTGTAADNVGNMAKVAEGPSTIGANKAKATQDYSQAGLNVARTTSENEERSLTKRLIASQIFRNLHPQASHTPNDDEAAIDLEKHGYIPPGGANILRNANNFSSPIDLPLDRSGNSLGFKHIKGDWFSKRRFPDGSFDWVPAEVVHVGGSNLKYPATPSSGGGADTTGARGFMEGKGKQ